MLRSRWLGLVSLVACACSAPETRKSQESKSQESEHVASTFEALGAPLALTDASPLFTSANAPFPYSGRVTSGSVSPTNDLVALVASERGGLWRTNDGGVTWSHVDGFLPFVMGNVLHAPSNANIVIATVTFDLHAPNSLAGIWRSTDGGVTWTQPPSAVPSSGPTAGFGIAFSPDSNHVYVGTNAGLAVSSDLGVTWTYVDPSPNTGGVLQVDARPGGIVNVMEYCSNPGGTPSCDETGDLAAKGVQVCNGFHRSTDHGATWPITGASPLGGAVALNTVTSSPFDPNVVLAIGTRNPVAGVSTCSRFDAFESDDGGQTWTSLNGVVTRANGRPPFIAAHAAADGVPGHFDVYYSDNTFTHRQTCSGTGPGLRCSTTWQDVNANFPGHVDNDAIAWSNTSNCPKFLLGDGGPQLSSDCGLNWTVTGGGPGGFHALQISDMSGTVHADTTDLYMVIQDNGNWVSLDSASHWGPPPKSAGAEGFNLELPHALATHDQTVASAFCGPCSYVKGNRDFTSITSWNNPPGNRPSSGPMFVEQNAGQKVWAQFGQPLVPPDNKVPPTTTDNNLFVSTDDAANWNQLGGATITETFRNLGDFTTDHIGTGDRGRFAGSGMNTTLYMPALKAANNANGLKRISGIRGGAVNVTNADGNIVLARSFFDRLQWAVDPVAQDHLVAVDAITNQVVTSENGGTSWTSLPLATTTASGSGKFFFDFQEFDVTHTVVSGLTSVNTIGIDNSNSNRILIGTEANGIIASFDRGATWIGVPGSEQAQSPLAFFFDEGHADVYVSTYGRGLWKMGWCSNAGGADTTPPSFAFVPPDITTANCGTIDIGTPRAVDVCGTGGVTVTNNRPAKFSPGTTLVTWTARDAAGNVTTATQKVTLLLGDDPACCPAGTHVILGTSNNDVLNGTTGADCILGRGGQDTINGLGGNDFISGGDGDDVINGGDGNDVVFGGSGQDQLTGGNGDDQLFGGDGDDTAHGSAGNDTLHGGQGQDHLFGDDDNDTLFGDIGSDTLDGGNGNDNLVGNDGTDVCTDASGTNTFATCETAPANSCTDGVGDGTETDIDCGGGCARCGNGKLCSSSNDCQSGVCAAGRCAPSSGIATSAGGLLQASLQITSDWGGGYCAALTVINNAFVPTVNWSVNININAATTFTTFNGIFSGASGPVTVTPQFGFNQVVQPGTTDNSIGFCANRNVPNSGALPAITAAAGQYF